eukprot:scaffold3717_cov124-Isochrysis_galbana.AAC.16
MRSFARAGVIGKGTPEQTILLCSCHACCSRPICNSPRSAWRHVCAYMRPTYGARSGVLRKHDYSWGQATSVALCACCACVSAFAGRDRDAVGSEAAPSPLALLPVRPLTGDSLPTRPALAAAL